MKERRKWIHTLNEGALHAAMNVPVDRPFTAGELAEIVKVARKELARWNARGNKHKADRARRLLRMALFAQTARKFKRPKKYGKSKKSYNRRPTRGRT